MNPFLDSQAQRNTPRGCGFAGACQKLSLLPRKQSKLNQRSRPGRPTRWRRRIRSSRGRNPKWVEKRVQSGGVACRALVEPHTTPIAARSSTRIVSVLRFSHPARLLRERRRRGRSQPKRRNSLPPRATAPATSAARRSHKSRTRCRQQLHVRILPRSRAPTASAGARCTYRTHGRHVKALGRGPTFC